MSKLENLAPLGIVLKSLIEHSGIELGLMDLIDASLAEMIGQYGINMTDVRVVRTVLNHAQVDEAKRRNQEVEPQYRYEAAFPDPHPEGENALITVAQFTARDWQAPSFARYADAVTPDLDEYQRQRGSTTVSHDAEAIFRDIDPKPQSVSAKRALAKKQEEEREALAAKARQARA
jgi:hypothetical protein